MKLSSFLTALIFIAILWAIVKTTPTRKDLAKHVEKDYATKDHSKLLNDGAESSADTQIQKYKETLKTKLKNKKAVTDRGGNKVFNKNEYNKEYYQKNKESLAEYYRNYYKRNKGNYYKRNNNKEEKRQYMKVYRQKNKERIQKNNKIYNQNNREKLNEYMRKYRQNKKNVQSDNNEGTSSVNPQTGDFTNKGKLPIVWEEEGNLLNHGEEECNNGEDEQNQIEVEELNKILEDNTIDLNKKILPFDLNVEPEDVNGED